MISLFVILESPEGGFQGEGTRTDDVEGFAAERAVHVDNVVTGWDSLEDVDELRACRADVGELRTHVGGAESRRHSLSARISWNRSEWVHTSA